MDILTLFLTLFIVSFTFVIFFNHFKQRKAIEAFSLGTIERASNTILERVRSIILDANRYPAIIDSLIWNENDISENNEDLILFLLKLVQLENNFSHIFAASLSGNQLAAVDLGTSSQRNFITRPNQPLPSGARYSIEWIDSSVEPHRNVWHYFDSALHPICYEESFEDTYDARNRPWFKGALEAKGIF